MKKIGKNKGSATLEMTLVMPIIIIISFILIKLLVFVLDEAKLRCYITKEVSNLSLLKKQEIEEDIELELDGTFSEYTLLENKIVLGKLYIKAENKILTITPIGEYSMITNCDYNMAINNISKYLRGRQIIEERVLQ